MSRPDTKIQQACRDFWQSKKTLVLSTRNAEGKLHSSQTPFAFNDQGELAIFVSALAQHTGNLLQCVEAGQCEISGMILADEVECEQIYARERLSLETQVALIKRDDAEFVEWMLRFEKRFGDIIATLQTLPDFSLFRLKVTKAVYVRGFAQAYLLEDGLDGLPQLQKGR